MPKERKQIKLFPDIITKGYKICNKIDRNFSQMIEQAIEMMYDKLFNEK